MLITTGEQQPERLEDLLPAELAARLDRLDVLSRKVFAGKLPGERRSKRRGQSVEFDDYREYTPGDDLRHVDWNVFARLDRFFIKLFREDEDLIVHLVLDVSPSMQGGATGTAPTKSLYARRLATALGYIALVNQNRVVAETFGAGPRRRLTPIRGRRQIDRLAAFFLDAKPAPGDGAQAAAVEPFDTAMRRVSNTRSGKGLMVVLSDLLVRDELERGLNYLHTGRGFDVVCIQTLSPGELDPASEMERGLRGDVRLADAESAAAAEVTVSRALLDRYHHRLDEHLDRIATLCRARGIRHVLLNTAAPVERVILDSLRRRRLVG